MPREYLSHSSDSKHMPLRLLEWAYEYDDRFAYPRLEQSLRNPDSLKQTADE